MEQLCDVSAEKAVLGGILINPGILVDVATLLMPDDFHQEIHRHIFDAMLGLQSEQTPLDYVTVTSRLDADGKLAAIGGAAYLTELVGSTPTSVNAIAHARVVSRFGTLRKLMTASASIAKLAYDAGNEQLDRVFVKARQLLDAATPLHSDEAVLLWLHSLDAFFTGQFDRVGELDAIEKGTMPARVDFPWEAVRRFVSYLRPGMLAVIAAESSVGKTVAMECCAEYWARQGLHCAFFHLELPHRFMLDRRMVRQSGEMLAIVERGEVTEKMRDADLRMRQWRGAIHYVHCPGWSAYEIVQKTRQLHARGLCDVAVIDYLQKLRLAYRDGLNKADAIGNAVEGIKTGLEQLGIPGVLGSQFNRQARHSDRKTSGLIRGSGEVEEKVNVVLTLDRDILDVALHDGTGRIVAQAGERSPVVKVRIDKNTAGPTGDCELAMNGARFRMLDVGANE